MHKDLDVSISTGRFRKIREWNRRRNYYFKKVKLNIKIYIAKLIWDKRRKVCLISNRSKPYCSFAMKGP